MRRVDDADIRLAARSTPLVFFGSARNAQLVFGLARMHNGYLNWRMAGNIQVAFDAYLAGQSPGAWERIVRLCSAAMAVDTAYLQPRAAL